MNGYTIGATVPADEPPWPLLWEQDEHVSDGHHHRWECVLLAADGHARVRLEEVVRCADCHAPRCGSSTDPDPCMSRRHHRDHHVLLSGAAYPIGGNRP